VRSLTLCCLLHRLARSLAARGTTATLGSARRPTYSDGAGVGGSRASRPIAPPNASVPFAQANASPAPHSASLSTESASGAPGPSPPIAKMPRRGSLMNALERTSNTVRKKLTQGNKRRSQEIVSGPFHVEHVSHGGAGTTEEALLQAVVNFSRSSDSTPTSPSSTSASLSALGEMAISSVEMESSPARCTSLSKVCLRNAPVLLSPLLTLRAAQRSWPCPLHPLNHRPRNDALTL
jgi:hypothetical protein